MKNNICKFTKRYSKDLEEIWSVCFGDSKKYIDFSLKHNSDNFFLVTVEDKAVSMLCVIPCEFKGEKGGYVYAVATLPEYRGKGYSRELLKYAEESMKKRMYSFSCLVPAEKDLFDFYSSQGYKNGFYCKTIHYKYNKSDSCNLSLEKIDCNEFLKIKNKFSKDNHIFWTDSHLRFLWEENNLTGGEIYKVIDGEKSSLVVVVPNNDTVYIKEILGLCDVSDIIVAVSNKYKKDCFARIEPLEDNMEPFGMCKNLKNNNKYFCGYISLVLD